MDTRRYICMSVAPSARPKLYCKRVLIRAAINFEVKAGKSVAILVDYPDILIIATGYLVYL